MSARELGPWPPGPGTSRGPAWLLDPRPGGPRRSPLARGASGEPPRGPRPSSCPRRLDNYASPDLPAHFRTALVRRLDNTPADNPTTDAGATLGRVLFYDRRLSADGTLSCGSCHVQAHAFADPGRFSKGVGGRLGDRNAMALVNARYHARGRFFWDERARTAGGPGPRCRSRTPARWPTTSTGSSRPSAPTPPTPPCSADAFGDEDVDPRPGRPGPGPVRPVDRLVPLEVRRRPGPGRLDRRATSPTSPRARTWARRSSWATTTGRPGATARPATSATTTSGPRRPGPPVRPSSCPTGCCNNGLDAELRHRRQRRGRPDPRPARLRPLQGPRPPERRADRPLHARRPVPDAGGGRRALQHRGQAPPQPRPPAPRGPRPGPARPPPDEPRTPPRRPRWSTSSRP